MQENQGNFLTKNAGSVPGKGKVYHTCTWDYSHTTGNFPWCSVDTDDNNKHHGGKDRVVIDGIKKKFWGICDSADLSARWLCTFFGFLFDAFVFFKNSAVIYSFLTKVQPEKLMNTYDLLNFA